MKNEHSDFTVDVTVYHRGFHGDLNETFLVGDEVKEETKKLVKVTYECLQHAIDIGEYSYLRLAIFALKFKSSVLFFPFLQNCTKS